MLPLRQLLLKLFWIVNQHTSCPTKLLRHYQPTARTAHTPRAASLAATPAPAAVNGVAPHKRQGMRGHADHRSTFFVEDTSRSKTPRRTASAPSRRCRSPVQRSGACLRTSRYHETNPHECCLRSSMNLLFALASSAFAAQRAAHRSGAGETLPSSSIWSRPRSVLPLDHAPCVARCRCACDSPTCAMLGVATLMCLPDERGVALAPRLSAPQRHAVCGAQCVQHRQIGFVVDEERHLTAGRVPVEVRTNSPLLQADKENWCLRCRQRPLEIRSRRPGRKGRERCSSGRARA